jgi:beta-glucosidase
MLAGFRRIRLAPGEKTLVEFMLARDQLAVYDRRMKRVVEAGTYQVTIGGLTATFEIRKEED